jgi:hypothetical protein
MHPSDSQREEAKSKGVVSSGWAVWGSLSLLFVCVLPMASDQQAQVLVVSVTGDWKQIAPGGNTQATIRFGQTLNAGGGCLFGKEGAVVLKYSTPASDALYPCPCEKPNNASAASACNYGPRDYCAVDLRTLNAKKGFFSAFASDISDTVSRLLSRQPDKYMVASSRGLESELSDAVVPLQSGRVDLSAAFREMDTGSYYVTFSAVGSAASSARAPIALAYKKGQPAVVGASSLQPGVYDLSLVDAKGQPVGSDSWVLVAGPTDYATKTAAFEKAVSASSKLPEEMDPGATRGVLRAYLESLARAPQGQRP